MCWTVESTLAPQGRRGAAGSASNPSSPSVRHVLRQPQIEPSCPSAWPTPRSYPWAEKVESRTLSPALRGHDVLCGLLQHNGLLVLGDQRHALTTFRFRNGRLAASFHNQDGHARTWSHGVDMLNGHVFLLCLYDRTALQLRAGKLLLCSSPSLWERKRAQWLGTCGAANAHITGFVILLRCAILSAIMILHVFVTDQFTHFLCRCRHDILHDRDV
jgi:hypothetical protein